MGTVKWQKNFDFINTSNPKVQGVLASRSDWIGFLDALGKGRDLGRDLGSGLDLGQVK